MKRALDVVVASVALALLGPLLLLVAVSIWVSMGWPVFFRQTRAGWRGKPFKVLKFRTLAEIHDAQGSLLRDKERVTRLGRMLRQTSFDELPQLINVLTGDMSLVGPRPLIIEYLKFYTPHQARRHEVRPGITGLAQIKGRNALSWDEKFAQDVWYVDHMSLALDLRILLQTAVHLVKRDSVSAEGDLDVPSFTGSPAAGIARNDLRGAHTDFS